MITKVFFAIVTFFNIKLHVESYKIASVFDGYWKTWNSCYSHLQLHMNWGWDGDFNGWYVFDNWQPGTRNYQYWQHFIHNINP